MSEVMKRYTKSSVARRGERYGYMGRKDRIGRKEERKEKEKKEGKQFI